jgi:hypothetical protein
MYLDYFVWQLLLIFVSLLLLLLSASLIAEVMYFFLTPLAAFALFYGSLLQLCQIERLATATVA